MQLLTLLLGVALFPFVGLGFLLWMARLEDSLPAAVRRAERSPDPAPIVAIFLTSSAVQGSGSRVAVEASHSPRARPLPRDLSDVRALG